MWNCRMPSRAAAVFLSGPRGFDRLEEVLESGRHAPGRPDSEFHATPWLVLRERALVPNAWLAQRLRMGATGAVSRTIRDARELADRDRKVRRAARELAAIVQSF